MRMLWAMGTLRMLQSQPYPPHSTRDPAQLTVRLCRSRPRYVRSTAQRRLARQSLPDSELCCCHALCLTGIAETSLAACLGAWMQLAQPWWHAVQLRRVWDGRQPTPVKLTLAL
jgi:hypothetical protein